MPTPITEPPPTIRVVLADDDPLVRRTLRVALAPLAIDVVAEAADGRAAVEMARRERPDAVLMDADMPRVDGITATVRIRRTMPSTPVLVVATTDDADLGVLALRAGASGFLTKDAGSDTLGRGLHAVARGETALSALVTQGLVEQVRSQPGHGGGLRPIRSALTTREWQVLDLMSAGASTNEIARDLVLSVATVRSHVKRILAKLGAHNRADAVREARRLREAPTSEQQDDRLDEIAFRRRFLHLHGRKAKP